MTPETLTMARPEVTARDEANAKPWRQRIPHPLWLGLGSGLALWLAFPPAEWHGLVWCALVPLLLLVRSERKVAAYCGAWLGGLVFWLLATEWVRLTDPDAWPAWLLMAVVLSGFWPLTLALTRLGVLRLGLPLPIAAPIVWVALEYIRAYVLTGFPWYYLAHTQFRQIELIQISDFAGAWGVSFLIAMVNACLVDAVQLPLFRPTAKGPKLRTSQLVRFGSVIAALMFALVYGVYRVRSAAFVDGPTVALMQSNLIQSLNTGRDPNETSQYFTGLVERAMATGRKLDLVVWPETSYPFGYVTIDPALDPTELDRQVRELDPDSTGAEWIAKRDSVDGHLHGIVNELLRAPMLVGTVVYEFRQKGRARYNSAVLFEPGKSEVQQYHKMHLVPFGEYVPLIETFPWLTYLTPYRGSRTPSLHHGPKPTWIDIGKYRYAVAICFEDTLPQVVRPLIAEVPDGHVPDVLINQSNDGWFHDSAAEHVMHLACSVFRAVEHRVPLARATNTGYSALIDGNGRILAHLETGAEEKMIDGVLVETVPLDPREGLYTKVGDWFALGCLAITIGWLPLSRFRPAKPRPA